MSKAKKRDPILRRKWKIILVGFVFLIAVFSPQGIRLYDGWADEWANPGYLGPGSPGYLGGWYEFSVDKEYPKTRVIVNFNTSVHNFNRTFGPDTSEWPVGFSCPHYWVVQKYTPGPDVFERVRISLYWFVPRFEWVDWLWWNGTHYEVNGGGYKFLYAELVVYDSWLSEPEYYDPVANITLYFEWHGWI